MNVTANVPSVSRRRRCRTRALGRGALWPLLYAGGPPEDAASRLAESGAPPPAPAQPQPAPLAERAAPERTRTSLQYAILLVDDDRGLQQAIGAILSDEGYEVIAAFDGLDALEKLAQRTPDLILLDIGMPNLDGVGLAAELRRRDIQPPIPILVLTAVGDASARARAIGAAGFLNKPFHLDELLQQVSDLLPRPPAD